MAQLATGHKHPCLIKLGKDVDEGSLVRIPMIVFVIIKIIGCQDPLVV